MTVCEVSRTSRELGCIPYRVDSSAVSCLGRDWYYWCDADFVPTAGERLDPFEGHVRLSLPLQQERLQILQHGHHFHADWRGSLLNCQGFQPRAKPKSNPAGLSGASPSARIRWRESGFALSPAYFEDSNMIWDSNGQCRLPSLLELCAMLGFPRHYLTAFSQRSRSLRNVDL